MTLTVYKRKRNFKKTPEPAGKKVRSKTGSLFVIQKHAASHLHYDFRLEWGGTLKSWAVPKRPSLNPADKRLAVHVEDHPIEYGGFEGTIPAGEYGGGTVMLWDTGTWAPAGNPEKMYRAGKLKFELFGERLTGAWALVRMSGERSANGKNWLLMKERDAIATSKPEKGSPDDDRSVRTGRTMDEIAAGRKTAGTRRSKTRADATWKSNRTPPKKTSPRSRAKKRASRPRKAKVEPSGLTGAMPARQPDFIAPQLALLVERAPVGDEWLNEIKFDGYRILAVKDGDDVRLMTRRQKDWTHRFPSVAEAVRALPYRQFIIDGEVIASTPSGESRFQLLQNQLSDMKSATLHYVVFDLLHCEGYDITACALIERKELLRDMLSSLESNSIIRFSEHVRGSGPRLRSSACEMALEGIIMKRIDAPYVSARTGSWLKVKCSQRQEFVIGGYSEPRKSRVGFGALLLGYYEEGKLKYCGKVGTGFDHAMLRSMHKKLKSIERRTPAFEPPPRGAEARNAHWVEPRLVAEIEFHEWTGDGRLRQPTFQGLREDKRPQEIRREIPHSLEEVAGASSNGRPRKGHRAPMTTKTLVRKSRSAARGNGAHAALDTKVAGITISNPDRVVYPDAEITKITVARYYHAISDWMLPHIVERPLSVIRCPQGRQKECFFQRRLTETLPTAVHGIEVKGDSGKNTFIYIRDLSGLIQLVQFGVLEFHPWGSRVDDVDKPDFVTFDLDPHDAVPWSRVRDAARVLRDMLAEFDLQSFIKTSGGKGLHVCLPIQRRSTWDEVKQFAHAISLRMTATDPEAYLATASKAKRTGKIFIDYLRNARSATSVAAYSTRARAGAPVSTPIEWDELSRVRSASAFDVSAVVARMKKLRRDPWADIYKVKQGITKSMLADLAARHA